MRTSVNLQEFYSYSVLPLLVVLVFIVLLTIYLWQEKKRKESPQLEEREVKKISNKGQKDIPAIKSKYLEQLDSIEYRYKHQKISLRAAYQEISKKIRLFVFEVTDIATQNYSLAEIKNLELPVLYELIAEYYEPEFASQPAGDFEQAIQKARSVIEKWN